MRKVRYLDVGQKSQVGGHGQGQQVVPGSVPGRPFDGQAHASMFKRNGECEHRQGGRVAQTVEKEGWPPEEEHCASQAAGESEVHAQQGGQKGQEIKRGINRHGKR